MAYHKVNIAVFVLYMIGMSALLIWQGIGITPDRYVLILILGSLFIGKLRKFLIDWLPFLFILISYDFLRSLAPILNHRVHFVEMINIDKAIFGQNPVIFLQTNFYNINRIYWYDYLAAFFYFLHFALPLAFAFILWLKNQNFFKKFSNALLVLSYSAFITYVIFPAAPPWLASKSGYLPYVAKILDTTLNSFPEKLNLPTIYANFNPNPVAAMPSLHAAYPMLVLMFAVKFFGKTGLIFVPYVISTWVSIVYLGEHYVADIILGVIYTVMVYYFTNQLSNHRWFNQ